MHFIDHVHSQATMSVIETRSRRYISDVAGKGSNSEKTLPRKNMLLTLFNGTAKRADVPKQSLAQATHIVRLNVLGLQGIHIEKKDEKMQSAGNRCSPKEMKAVVAVSRGQKIKATTPPSEPLSKLRNRVGKLQKDSRGDTYRYSAHWNSSRGALLEFDVTLNRLNIGGGEQSSSQFLPKGYDLTAALTEDTLHKQKVALPIGIAELVVSGNNNGEILVMDLPLRRLNDVHPGDNDQNGLHGFPMISINDKKHKSVTPRRLSLGRWARNIPDDESQKVPSICDRKVFSSVYGLDPVGDSVLRVQVQVIEKSQRHAPLRKESPKVKSVSISLQHHSESRLRVHGKTSEPPAWAPPLLDDPSVAEASEYTMTTGSADTLSTTSEVYLHSASRSYDRHIMQIERQSLGLLDTLPSCGDTLLSDDASEASGGTWRTKTGPWANSCFAHHTQRTPDFDVADTAEKPIENEGAFFDFFRAGNLLNRTKGALWRCGPEDVADDLLSVSTEDRSMEASYQEEKVNAHRGNYKKNRLIEIISASSVASSLKRDTFQVPATLETRRCTIPVAIREVQFVKNPDRRMLV